MSKAKFRSRKVDFRRPLPVYRASEVPDLDDGAGTSGFNLQRSIQMVETGVDKDEEGEHHLQAVISASQIPSGGGPRYIPTPDASKIVDPKELGPYRSFRLPQSNIRSSATVEEVMGCPYTADEEDDAWLKAWKDTPACSIDVFEWIMYELESLAEARMPSSPPIQVEADLLPRLEEVLRPTHPMPPVPFLRGVLTHWSAKRGKLPPISIPTPSGPGAGSGAVPPPIPPPLMPRLRTEDLYTDSDPYVCFRRRDQKPMRKTRRSDAMSLTKLHRLRAQLGDAASLAEMVDRREKMRRESILLEQLAWKSRLHLRDVRKSMGFPNDGDGLFHLLKVQAKRKEAGKFLIHVKKPGGLLPSSPSSSPSLGGHKDRKGLSGLSGAAAAAAAAAESARLREEEEGAEEEEEARRVEELMATRRRVRAGWTSSLLSPPSPYGSEEEGGWEEEEEEEEEEEMIEEGQGEIEQDGVASEIKAENGSEQGRWARRDPWRLRPFRPLSHGDIWVREREGQGGEEWLDCEYHPSSEGLSSPDGLLTPPYHQQQPSPPGRSTSGKTLPSPSLPLSPPREGRGTGWGMGDRRRLLRASLLLPADYAALTRPRTQAPTIPSQDHVSAPLHMGASRSGGPGPSALGLSGSGRLPQTSLALSHTGVSTPILHGLSASTSASTSTSAAPSPLPMPLSVPHGPVQVPIVSAPPPSQSGAVSTPPAVSTPAHTGPAGNALLLSPPGMVRRPS